MLALLRETGILCVYGSGFGMPPEAGSFRIVYLADPSELRRFTPISPRSRGGICSRRERSLRFPARADPLRTRRPGADGRHLLGALGSQRCAGARLYQRARGDRPVPARQRHRTQASDAAAGPALGGDPRHLSLHHWRNRRRRYPRHPRDRDAGTRPGDGAAAAAAPGPTVADQSRAAHARDQRAGGRAADGDELRRPGHDRPDRRRGLGICRRRVRRHHDARARLLPDGRQRRDRHDLRPAVPARQTRAASRTRAGG